MRKALRLPMLFIFFFALCLWTGRQAVATVFDHSHGAFTKLLQNTVIYKGQASEVNYPKLKEQRAELEKYLGSLSAVTPAEFKSFSPAQQKAFLINAYNGFTLKLIIDNYPVKSIKKLGGLFSSPWKKKFFNLLGQECHLDRIEHEWLRPKFKDSRIHYAVNCASIGCPRLRNEAYRADSLDKQLNEQADVFFKDSSRNRIVPEKQLIEISKIFDWFEEDFKPSPKEYVIPYLTTDAAVRSNAKDFKLKFTDYDWSLNELKP